MKVIIFLSLIIFIFSSNYTNLTRLYRRIQLECEEISDRNLKQFNDLNSTGEFKYKTDHDLGYSYYYSEIYQFTLSIGESIDKMANLIRKKENLLQATESETKSFFEKLAEVDDFYVHDKIRQKSFTDNEYSEFTTFKGFVNYDSDYKTYVIFIDRVYVKNKYIYCSQNAWGEKNCKTYSDKSLNDRDTNTFLLKGIGMEALGNSKDILDDKKITVFN